MFPGAIRFALMMTVYVHDRFGGRIIDAASANACTVWDIRSGHVDPNKAVDPGACIWLHSGGLL